MKEFLIIIYWPEVLIEGPSIDIINHEFHLLMFSIDLLYVLCSPLIFYLPPYASEAHQSIGQQHPRISHTSLNTLVILWLHY